MRLTQCFQCFQVVDVDAKLASILAGPEETPVLQQQLKAAVLAVAGRVAASMHGPSIWFEALSAFGIQL